MIAMWATPSATTRGILSTVPTKGISRQFGMNWGPLIAHYGNVASVASLAISIWIAIGVAKIRRSYVFRGTSTRLVSDLEEATDSVLAILNDYPREYKQVRPSISKLRGVIDGMLHLLTGPTRSSAKQLSKRIRKFNIQSYDAENRLREVYADAVYLRQALNALVRDTTWQN